MSVSNVVTNNRLKINQRMHTQCMNESEEGKEQSTNEEENYAHTQLKQL